MQARLATFGLLVAASVTHLPVVYGVVGRGADSAPVALSVGLLSMGLAWSAGCCLESRRRRTARAIAAAGIALPLLAWIPGLGFPMHERLLLAAGGILSAGGLWTMMKAR